MIDITGKRFGRLMVIRYVGNKAWECRCDCGKITTGCASDMKRGFKKSCGCFQREGAKIRRTTHGLSYTSEYWVWASMMARCFNPNEVGFKNYGHRGITVCPRWRTAANFLADMGKRPSPKHSIDRINNDGNYEPGNCRWATRIQQNRNMRRVRFLMFNGESKCISEWATIYGLNESVLRRRLDRGWSIEEAISLPPCKPGSKLERFEGSKE
jgi:hypothetical protein